MRSRKVIISITYPEGFGLDAQADRIEWVTDAINKQVEYMIKVNDTMIHGGNASFIVRDIPKDVKATVRIARTREEDDE
jgi:hypothetical protein